MLNEGDGTFGADVAYATGGVLPIDMQAADFNNDTYPDMIVSNRNGDTVGVLINDGDGTFANAETYTATGADFGTALADLNNDNFIDIVTANDNSNSISVLLNDGDGTFGDEAVHALGGAAEKVATGVLIKTTF